MRGTDASPLKRSVLKEDGQGVRISILNTMSEINPTRVSIADGIAPLLIAASIPIAFGAAIIIWRITNAFHGELIHQELMALGDVRELTTKERLSLGIVWIPFGIFIIGAVIVYGIIIMKAISFWRRRIDGNVCATEQEAGGSRDNR